MCTQEYYPKGSGIANVAYYLVEEMKRKGHDVRVLSPYGPDISVGYEKAIAKYAGIGLLFFWNKVRKFVNKNHNDFDLIYVHNPLFLGKIKPRKKIFSIVHTTYVKYYELYKSQDVGLRDRIYYLLMKYVERLCYRNKFKSSGVSSEVVKELKRLGVKGLYIPNGVDTAHFSPGGSFELDVSGKILLAVGRLNQQKRPDLLIKVFSELGDDKSLVFAGDGELMGECKKIVKDLGMNNVHFLGKVDHKELRGLYSRADFFIMSSCYEGQPLTLLEAMSCGLPCILSDIPNITHFVRDSKTGLVVDFESYSAAENILNYMDNVDRSKESLAVRKFAVDNLDWSKIAERYLGV